MATPTPSRTTWLQRLRRRLRPGPGDVIMANVGQGASDVIVGKNILKIGTLVIPALPAVIALLVVLAAGGTGLWLDLVPATMGAPFNVALAEIGVIDGQGRQRGADADSAKIGRTLFASVQEELRRLPSDYTALVWHDSMNFLQKRSTIGVIGGATDSERAAAACLRAGSLGADMIVFGLLDERTKPAILRLQFCFQNKTRSRDMGSLEELQKADRLGSPLLLDLPLSDVSSAANPPLKVRTTLAAKLVVGLRYELGGAVNFQASLHRALGVFTGALQYLQQEDGAATRDNGGDVVHYFIGREHFLLAQEQGTAAETKRAELANAQAALEQAIALNTQFSRAWTALGGVFLQQSQQELQQPGRSEQTINDLQGRMRTAYETAIEAAKGSTDQTAEAEGRLALALGDWLQAEAAMTRRPPDRAAAEAALTRAGEQRGSGATLIRPAQVRLRGFAEMIQGVVANRQAVLRVQGGDPAGSRAFFVQARDAYRRCEAAGNDDPGDQFLKGQIIATTCMPGEQAVSQALQQLPPTGEP